MIPGLFAIVTMDSPAPPVRAASRSLWLVLALLAAGALGLWLWLGRTGKNAASAAPERPAPVAVSSAAPGPLEVVERYFGELRAVTDAALGAGEAGRVVRVHVREGDRVKKGQVLLELDAGLVRAEASRARAQANQSDVELEQAERDAKRAAELGKESIVSKTEIESAQTRAEAVAASKRGAKASVQVIRERIARHRIVAPFDGVIARRNADPGDWLTPGFAALSLVTDDRVEIFARVPPGLLDRLGNLDSASARIEKDGDSVAATVAGVVGALDPATRTALVRLRPNEQKPWLRAGDTAHAAFTVTRMGGLVVPRDALVYGVADVRVIKVVDGKAVPAKVTVTAAAENRALVQSKELGAGDTIVVRGNERLRPGQSVAVAPAGSTPAPSASAP